MTEQESRPKTLPRMVLERARQWEEQPALSWKPGESYEDISWRTLGKKVRRFGRAFLSLGLETGERVALMCPNRPEWAYTDLGALAAGGLSVPVYHTEGIDTVMHILKDSGSRFFLLYSAVIWEDLRERLEEVPELERVVLLEGEAEGERLIALEAFLKGAEEQSEEKLEERLASGRAEEPATIVYTSGTTGPPKGVVLTHANLLSNIEACAALFELGPRDRSLSFLPLSHVFERMAGYYLLLHEGVTIAYAENFDSVPANLQEVRPTVVTSVPRLYEKMYARVMERVLNGPWLSRQLFFGALKVARLRVAREQAGEEVPAWLEFLTDRLRKLVFSRLAERLGGRLRFFISGGAPLGKDIAEFFMAAGLPILEGYGLTETSPVISANTLEEVKLGTVGRPLPGTEVRIADDGEIQVRGPGIFREYWRKPELTEEVFVDGWFRTGDIGELDEDGFLSITDRKKELIVTAGGENIAPQPMENRLKTSKYLSNAMIYGDRKPYLTALLVPNFENLEKHARQQGIDFLNHCDLVSHARILELIRDEVDQLQQNLQPVERVKRFTLLSRDFSGDQGELTPTMKLRRKVIEDHFHRVLEGMYQAEDKGIHDQGFCVVEDAQEEGGTKDEER